MKYNEYRTEAQTGDVVLFSGKGPLSNAIKWFCRSKWSHVGVVVVDAVYDLVALWESTTLCDVRDIDSGRFVRGVQTVPLSERVRAYDGDVGVRRVKRALSTDEIGIVRELRREFAGRPYEENTCELIRSAYDGPFGQNAEDLSSVFCSELVAELYIRLGWLPESPANEYTPQDFEGTCGDKLGALAPLVS